MLKLLSKLVLWRGKPTVIGVTGSQGKTVTKAAIAAVLKTQGTVRTTLQNVKSEEGTYRSILGCVRRNNRGAFWCVVRSVVGTLFGFTRYPDFLVAEIGADAPGHVRTMTQLTQPAIGVFTLLSTSTLERFGHPEKAMREYANLFLNLPSTGWAVLNGDDTMIMELKSRLKARVITFGLGPGVDVRATDMMTSQDLGPDGTPAIRGVSFKLSYRGSVVPVFLAGALGEQHVLAATAAAAVGIVRGLHLVELSSALKFYQAPGGRMTVVPGIKHTVLLDDTYNGVSSAAENALIALSRVPVKEGNHRFAIFGDLTDVAERSEEVHTHLGSLLPEKNIHWLVTVGVKSRDMDRGARKAGMNDSMIAHFATAEEAGRFVQEKMKKGDVLLVKGDPALHMERIVKELMAEPLKACDLLVRQDADWECR